MFCNGKDISLEGIGYFKSGAVDFTTPHAIQPGFELIELVTEGVVYYDIGGVEMRSACGTLFWEVPGDYTISRSSAQAPYRCLTVRFYVSGSQERTVPFVTVIDHEVALDLADGLLRAYHDEAVDRNYLCQYAYSRLQWEAYNSANRDKARHPRSIQRVISFISKNLASDLSVAVLAQAGGISEPHLHALFKKHLGTTPHQYVLQQRLQEARVILAEGNRPIKDISFDCGFANVEVFCRSFKKHNGMTPTQYRVKHDIRYRFGLTPP